MWGKKREGEPKIEEKKKEKNKPQKTRKHTKPRCGKKKIMVWEGCDLCGYCFTVN